MCRYETFLNCFLYTTFTSNDSFDEAKVLVSVEFALNLLSCINFEREAKRKFTEGFLHFHCLVIEVDFRDQRCGHLSNWLRSFSEYNVIGCHFHNGKISAFDDAFRSCVAFFRENKSSWPQRSKKQMLRCHLQLTERYNFSYDATFSSSVVFLARK